MDLTKKVLIFAAAVAIASVLALAVAPRAAHAVASILVTVTNTSANPVPTNDLSRSATQNVELVCFSQPGTVFALACGQVGLQSGVYTVPPGQNLVITTIDVTPQGAVSGTTVASIAALDPQSLSFLIRETFTVPNGTTTQLQFPVAGIVIRSGLQPIISNIDSNTPTTFVNIRGYLTSD